MNRGSLVARSIVAILLLVGFYVLALGIAAGLLWTVYLQLMAGHLVPKLALIAVVIAGIIVWSIIPRPDRFEPPGPELHEEDHPRLFELIRDVAKRTEQEMPREVYLVADVNAFVMQRGGIMGFFSKRVMGLGLPLLSLLTVSELRGVLAHEFGHYHGGDTKLGPWIYKTRGAIGRTIVSLAQGGSTIVRKPFEWYGNFFLKVTHSISRAQELAADELAARVVGAGPLVRGLKAVHAGAAAYGAYIRQEVVPVLEAGYRPPLSEGFRTFIDGRKVKASLEKLVAKELEEGEQDPFDTHPPLAQRVEALEALGVKEQETDDRLALELLDEPETLEGELIREGESGPLKPLSWSNVARRVYLPQWRKGAKQVAEALKSPTLAALPRSKAKLGKVAAKVLQQDLSEHADVAEQIGANMLAAAVCATLEAAGWTVKNRVGRPISMRNGELKLSPFEDFSALVSEKLTVEDVVKKLSDAGVAELVVGASAAGEDA
jgi:Zn-dependent protease with chaperone function